MPGTPVIYYGDEIGMGDNIYLGDRDGVRTPMQWSPDRNGGFSRADPAALVLPPIMDPLYGYQAVNVEAQSRDPHSLLNWMRRMLAVRQQHQAFGRGTLRFLYPTNRKVLAYLREYAKGRRPILCVANVVAHRAGGRTRSVASSAAACRWRCSAAPRFPPIGQLPYLLTLPPYGFLLVRAGSSRAACRPGIRRRRSRCPNLQHLRAAQLARGAAREPRAIVLEHDMLPAYLPKRRWFGGKDEKIERSRSPRSTSCRRAPTVLLPRSDGDHSRRHRALRAAARHRLGGRAGRPLCRSSWRWRACAAGAASVC